MIFKKFIFIAIFFSFTKIAIAQFASYRPGFIIDQKQDTVRGLLLYKENSSRFENCYFKSTEDGEVAHYKPDQLIAYHFDNDAYFESRTITNDSIVTRVFAEILVKGRASLLKVKNEFFLEDLDKQLFILNTNTREVGDLGNRRIVRNDLYKGVLTWKFTDCSAALSKVPSTQLNKKSLTKLFEIYNGCFGENLETPNNQKPWSTISAGISVGVITTKLEVEEIDLDYKIEAEQFNKDISTSVGVSFNFTFPRISEKIQLNVDALYQRQTFESLRERPYEYQAYYFEYSSIQIPISMLYSLSSTKIKPAFEVGLSPKISMNSSSLYTLHDISPPYSVYSDFEKNSLRASRIYVFPFAGLILSGEIKDHFLLFLKCRYHHAASSALFEPSVPEKGLSISMGLLYRIKK